VEVTRSKEDSGETRTAKPQGLTREGFDALLAQLDPDREKAGERYETIRRKLVRLFEWRGCDGSADLADETINRVARRMAEGIELKSADPYGYFCGVAHLVFKEVLRRSSREFRSLESGEWPPPIYVPDDEEEPADRRLECLRHCLGKIPPDQRDLLLRYYQGKDHQGKDHQGKDHQGEGNIRNRKALSSELNIPLNALRIRVHRVRRKIEDCVQGCLNH
jgi:DNA-directed RNA polymerase specialized sigma24 family protein